MNWASMVRKDPFMVRKKPKNSFKKKFVKGFRGCNPCVSKISTADTAGEIFNNFINNTTLIGIPHIIKKKSLFWLFAYCACMSLSVYQSWQSAVNFIDQVSHQSASLSNMMKLPWPSITVCNNVVLHLSFLNDNKTENIPGYVDLADSHISCNESYIDAISERNTLKIMEFVRTNLTEEQRWNQSLARPEWIEKCWFNYDRCNFTNTTEFFEFNSPYDGNCFTFNPTFNLTDGISSDLDTKLILHFRRYGIGYQLRGKKSYVSVLIHSPGTTPLMDLPEAIDIYDRQNINLGLRLIINDFMLKARTVIPTCVADTPKGKVFRKKNFYYNETLTPYKYSVEACMKSCVQNKVNTPCGVLDATFPVLHEFYENLNATQPPIQACDATEDVDVGMDQCQCPFPCRYFQYVVSTDTTELEKNTNPHCNTDHNHTENENEETLTSMRVSVQFLSNIYAYNEEVLDYDLTQFLGFLGGNVSLWLGLCVLSILEVFELIRDLIALGFKKLCHKDEFRPKYPLYKSDINRIHNDSYTYGGYSMGPAMSRKCFKRISFYNNMKNK